MDLLEEHFRSHGNTPDHLCYRTFRRLFEEIEARGPEGMRDLNILETGTAAWGTKSTLLFDAYVRRYGGRFWSVDIGKSILDAVRPHVCPATTLVHDDSVNFLSRWVASHPGTQAHVVYLDSYDVVWDNPAPAAQHGLREYEAIRPALGPGSLLLIDDTPSCADVFASWNLPIYDQISQLEKMGMPVPGKGMHVTQGSCKPPATLLDHWYQVLYRF